MPGTTLPNCGNQECLLTLPNIPWQAELPSVRTADTQLMQRSVANCSLNDPCSYCGLRGRGRKQRGNWRVNSHERYFRVVLWSHIQMQITFEMVNWWTYAELRHDWKSFRNIGEFGSKGFWGCWRSYEECDVSLWGECVLYLNLTAFFFFFFKRNYVCVF